MYVASMAFSYLATILASSIQQVLQVSMELFNHLTIIFSIMLPLSTCCKLLVINSFYLYVRFL